MKYIERWNEDLSFIIGYYEVTEEYQLTENEALCTKESYELNKSKYEQKTLARKKYANNQVITYLALKERSKATEEIVNIINENHIIKTTRSDEKPEMWVWKEGIYLPEGKSLIKQVCREILGEAHTNHITNEVIAKIEADTYIDQKEFFNEQNKYPYLIPVGNGLLNIKTKKLESHQAIIPFFNKLNADYNEKQDCQEIKKFLEQILATENDIKIIKQMIGFCLIKEYKYEKAFMLYGSQGRNGKSKLLELITRLFGINNVSGISLQDIEKDDFALSSFHNKLINISGDISREALSDTGKFKSLTGRDTISANRKFKERVEFINYAKIIFAANNLPKVYNTTDAFWLRWVIIEFPYQFLPKKEIDALSEEEKENVKIQDPLIINKITTPQELNGLLNFALEGFDELEEEKDFSTTKIVREMAKDWKRKSNSVEAFIEDCIKESFDNFITKRSFLKEYQAYCKKHRINIESDKSIKNTLKEVLGVSESRPTFEGQGRVLVWSGISWK